MSNTSNDNTAFALNTDLAPAPIANSGIAFLSAHTNEIYAAGQPSPEQYQLLKEAGVKHVINLRPESETNGSEAPLIESMEMQFYALPIAGPADITPANAQAMADLIEQVNGEPAIIHCASSNRIGALIALQKIIKGDELEASIAEGRRWGLTKLEAAVRQQADTL